MRKRPFQRPVKHLTLETLAKIVNGLRYLKACMAGGLYEEIKVLFACTFRSMIRVTQLI